MFRTTNNNGGFTIIELIIAISILGFLVAATISAVNYKKDAVQQTASKLMSDLSAIEMAFTNYSTDRNAYPSSLNDTTFVGGKYLFVPAAVDGFTAYSMSSNADGYYICTSASVSGTTDYKYTSIEKVLSKAPAGKAFRNTVCPATTNANPTGYPATIHLTYWIFRN